MKHTWLTLLVISLFVIAGCTENSESAVQIDIGQPCEIASEKTRVLGISGSVTDHDDIKVTWEATSGTFSDVGTISATYKAPKVETKTDVKIMAKVTSGGKTEITSADCIITASSQIVIPTETNTPKNTTTPTSLPLQETPTNTELIPTNTSSPNTMPILTRICGDIAFNNDLQTTDPVFLRPENYLSGWVSSDPAIVILPDGTSKTFSTQFVLIVDDISSIQLKNVLTTVGKANVYGCWYPPGQSEFIEEESKRDFCVKKANNNIAGYYRVGTSGFEEIGTTSTLSCP